MGRGKSPRPPSRGVSPAPVRAPTTPKVSNKSYKSDGVNDNDIFLLPGVDYLWALAVTALALVVRVWKIYQPTSVVFDEVQYATSHLAPFETCRYIC